MNIKNISALSLLVGCVLPVNAQSDSIAAGSSFEWQKMEVGANKNFARSQSTAAVTIIENKNVNKRSSKDIGNSIIGQGGNGLVSLQGAGTCYSANPTFYIRGLQSLSTNTPLVLVDGIERDLSYVDPNEVDHVAILKDAAAVALYGNKGANGVIQITTKRGVYNSREIKVNYDHLFNYQINRPKFINAQTYASATLYCIWDKSCSFTSIRNSRFYKFGIFEILRKYLFYNIIISTWTNDDSFNLG